MPVGYLVEECEFTDRFEERRFPRHAHQDGTGLEELAELFGGGGVPVLVDEAAGAERFGDAEAGGSAVLGWPGVVVPLVAGGGIGVQADRPRLAGGRVG